MSHFRVSYRTTIDMHYLWHKIYLSPYPRIKTNIYENKPIKNIWTQKWSTENKYSTKNK